MAGARQDDCPESRACNDAARFPPPLSHPARQTVRMKNRVLAHFESYEGQVIAKFGDARLVNVHGQIELQGGSMSDRMEALEWMSLFLPDECAIVK